ncbi:hypothetical protein AAG906_019585 [Vitis piasezkii]
MLWRKLIVGKFGEEPGGWCSKEGREGHGVGLWKCTKKDGELLKPKQDLRILFLLYSLFLLLRRHGRMTFRRFRGEEDKMVWKASKNGVFSMRGSCSWSQHPEAWVPMKSPKAAHGGGKIVLKGLYSGLAGNLAGVLPASAIFVGVYEPTKQKLLKTIPENLSAFAHLTAGAVGGAASSLVRVPTEVVKQRMQTGQFASATDAVQLIVAKEGFKGLYAGYGSFLLRDLPFDALQFCIYEQLRIGYKLAAQRDLNDPENAMIGAFSGAITGAITTPLDVIKTRLMVQGSANQYKGIFDCVRTVIREEGTPALFKGIGPRVLWIGIGGSIFFVILERTKQVVAQTHLLQKIPCLIHIFYKIFCFDCCLHFLHLILCSRKTWSGFLLKSIFWVLLLFGLHLESI